MKLSLGFGPSCNRIIELIKKTDVLPLSGELDTDVPPTTSSMPINTWMAGRVSTADRKVLPVLGVRCFAQIRDAVVFLHAVDVVNLVGRPSAVNV